jgi:hypothetical protein
MNLSARLNKLERIDNAGRVIVMWRRADEDNDAAHARWCAEHPDQAGAQPGRHQHHDCEVGRP